MSLLHDLANLLTGHHDAPKAQPQPTSIATGQLRVLPPPSGSIQGYGTDSPPQVQNSDDGVQGVQNPGATPLQHTTYTLLAQPQQPYDQQQEQPGVTQYNLNALTNHVGSNTFAPGMFGGRPVQLNARSAPQIQPTQFQKLPQIN